MQHYETIKVKYQKRIGIISLNRPKVLNAINNKMIDEVTDVIAKLNSEPNVACIIINGEGRCFSAGFDMKEAAERSIKGEKELLKIAEDRVPILSSFYLPKKNMISYGNAKGRVIILNSLEDK